MQINKSEQSKVDTLSLKLENGKIVPATRTKSTNSILDVPDIIKGV